MEEESFTYVLAPTATTEDCAHRVLIENLPSLDEAMESSDKMCGTLLIEQEGFIMDALRSFCRSPDAAAQHCIHENEKETEKEGMPCLPSTPRPTQPAASKSFHPARSPATPPLFQRGVWPLVWAQFQRDVARETLIIDGAHCSDALAALDRIQELLSESYDEHPPQLRGNHQHTRGSKQAEEDEEGRQGGGVASSILNSAWNIFGNIRHAYVEMVKERKLAEAVRLAILTAQQTVMAFPMELLQAQFSRMSQGDCSAKKNGHEGKARNIIYIGEPYVNNTRPHEETSSPTSEGSRRMIVRLERRRGGRRSPFIRVEKYMHVFSFDESESISTKLQLWIVIEVYFFTADHVELSWEWRRPPSPSPKPAEKTAQPPEFTESVEEKNTPANEKNKIK